ncbi:MAG TPA: hypothetical protein VH092_06830, partial [Urbifossiella sp.]|nr:hypothetical protein [Urbifossiella sp.]
MPWQSGGPVAVPNQITGAYQFAQAEDLDDDGLFLDMRGVYLALSHPDRAAELVGRFRNPVRVADVAPAIGLTIFPAPDLVTRWIDGPPPARAIRDARWLFSIAPDLFGRRLRDELDRRLPGPSNAAWSDSVEAERVPIEYVREHLTEGIRRELDRWREAVSRLPQIEHDLGVDREVLGEFDFRVDRQVRLALLMLDELTGRLHEVEAIDTALRRNYCIVSPAGTHGRSASELLDTSVTQAIFILLAARNLESEGRSFAAAAARSRGIIGPGQPLTDDALRELRVMTRPPELAPSDDAPDEIAGTDPPGPSILPAEGDGPFGTNGFRFAGAEVQ